MPVRLLHLSDLHLNAAGTADNGVDADRSLELVLKACEHITDVAGVVVTGDIADDGSVAAYERVRSALLDFAGARGAHLIMSTGNHDDRDAFAAVLGNGHFSPEGDQSGVTGPDGSICATSDVGSLRIVTLDSLVPGMIFGRLGESQLTWLAGLLAADPLVPTVLAFHHPPVDVGVEIQQRVRLDAAEQLASVVRGSSVAAILCGHFHQQVSGWFGGAPTWVTPGVFTQIEHLSVPSGHQRTVAGGGATVVDLTDPSAPLFATVSADDPQKGREVHSMTREEATSVLDRAGLPSKS